MFPKFNIYSGNNWEEHFIKYSCTKCNRMHRIKIENNQPVKKSKIRPIMEKTTIKSNSSYIDCNEISNKEEEPLPIINIEESKCSSKELDFRRFE